jgi:predicted LPLAT superfamily acyltransferase
MFQHLKHLQRPSEGTGRIDDPESGVGAPVLENVKVDFLGGRVRVPITPYQLASATGAPVVVIFPYKSGPGNYSLQVAKVIRVPGGMGRAPEAYRPFAEAFIRSLEGFVEERPYQFFNFFDMWSQEPMR